MNETPSPPSPGYPRKRLRWLAPPLAAMMLVAGFALASSFAGAQSPPPVLPPISAEELVAKVLTTSPEGISGTIQTNNRLGLPSIEGIVPEGAGPLGVLLSPHRINIQAAPGKKLRASIPDWMAESAIVSNGSEVWLWDSETHTVTHLRLPPHDEGQAAPDEVVPTPETLAKEALAAVDPTTRVFVRGTASVAGRSAYELVAAPRTPTSTVADVVIDVDSETGFPLRFQVLAKDSPTPALDIGFSEISFGAPPASTFEFTPPGDATVREVTSPEQLFEGHRDGDRDGVDDGDREGDREEENDGPAAPAAPAADVEPKVLGEGWDTVVAVGGVPAEVAELGRPVSGPWGSGRLITSTLVNALVLDDGTALIGAVTQERLQAAVAELRAGS